LPGATKTKRRPEYGPGKSGANVTWMNKCCFSAGAVCADSKAAVKTKPRKCLIARSVTLQML
jgi:hypothetical protein